MDDVIRMAIPIFIMLLLAFLVYIIAKKADVIIRAGVEVVGRLYGVV